MLRHDHALRDALQENIELRLRLEEAEETLRAIRGGEIDALVINGSRGEQVFTLIGADHPYRTLIEEMNEGALTLAPDGTILYCNRSFAAMIDTPQQNIIGGRFRDLVVSDGPAGFLGLLARGGDGSARGEISLRRGDGGTLPAHLSLSPVCLEGNECFALVITDLTEVKEHHREMEEANRVLRREVAERRRSEEALQQSEARFSRAFHSSPVAMAVTSLKDGRYIDVNSAWLSTMGFSRGEVIGLSAVKLNIWADPDKINGLERKIRETGGFRNEEFRLFAKNGRVITVVASAETVDMGSERCVLRTMTDITELRHMEKGLSRLDRLNLIGEMAASIGHEVRNPMTTVRGFLQMVSEKEGCQEYRDYFDLMLEELDRVNTIITEYLSMAKDKAIEMKPRYLNSIVKALYPMIQADATLTDKVVRLELGRPPRMQIDEKEIRQMILNMTRNGIEAMSPGGTLTIGTRSEGETGVLYIKDEGGGFDPALLEKLGTPFVTTKENGTGLGLAVCYSIANRHQAKIEVDTGPGGTTFTVRFNNGIKKGYCPAPLAPAPAPAIRLSMD